MQTLIEKIYGQKIGEDRRYRALWPDEIRIPAIFPGRGVDLPMELPGPKMPTEIPLEVRLGYQAPQSLYAMYSFGIQDSQPFLGGYDLPETGLQLHLHGPELNTITYGSIEDYSGNVLKTFNGFEASMAAYNADTMGFKQFWP